ncbi:T9SS type A sorting domain-containing protein [Flavobacterium sp.]|uniref:T9SS type A sorting domain-containing protein n=1 Tax=Flavobacterium sp. TaxID=239 RepID=UPI00286ADDD8|nr:T9SS type A sorting domain-containing protein [Flavobacterium sp.]
MLSVNGYKNTSLLIPKYSNGTYIINCNSNILVKGFTIDCANDDGTNGGIAASFGMSKIIIDRCFFNDNSAPVYFYRGINVEVYNSIFKNNSYCFYGMDCIDNNIVINNSLFLNTRYPIFSGTNSYYTGVFNNSIILLSPIFQDDRIKYSFNKVLITSVNNDNYVGTYVKVPNVEAIKFTDYVNENFSLTNYSPAIGYGFSSIGVVNDILGNSRPNPYGSNPDVGPFESALGLPTNKSPTLNQISDIYVNQNVSQQTVNLSGISDGDISASQNITITATSNNKDLIPNPAVIYSSNTTTGILQFTPVSDESGSAIITVTVHDNGGVLDGGIDIIVRTFTVIVNSTPTDIILSANSVPENLNNKVIGNLSVIDINIIDTHTFQFVSGNGDTNNANFVIVNGNQLQNVVPFDFETKSSYSIRLQVRDNAGNTFEKTFAISIVNLNEIAITYSAVNLYCSGSISINTVTNTSGIVKYFWTASNGGLIQTAEKNSPNLTNLSAGTYTINITDDYFNYSQNIIITLLPQFQNINVCFVSSDEAEVLKNRVYINNQGAYNVGFYEILRETNISNYYTSIGTITASENSFLDLNSDNTSKSYRYKVRLVDNCGNASSNSGFHKTILLQSTVAINNSVSLSWTPYEGISYGTYNIYRKTNLGLFELIGSIPSTDYAYNDQTANITSNKYEYYVAIDVNSCSTNVAGKIKGVSAIKSNRQKLGNSLSIDANKLSSEIILYPNPVFSKVFLKIPESLELNGIEIYNSLGQSIKFFKEKEFSVDFLPTGTYLMKIFTNQGTVVKNFIKK